MRLRLLVDPRLLVERLAEESLRRRRLARIRSGPAAGLELGHIDTLELLELLREAAPTCICDIGANVGTWTRLARSVFPSARIDAFEPLPRHFEAFARDAGTLPGVFLHEVALGDRDGCATLNVASFTDASSILPIARASGSMFGVEKVAELRVPIHRLDDYRERNALPQPDLLKLDVQGFELAVLAGARRTLAHARAVILEVSFVELYEGQPLFSEVCARMGAEGFEVAAFGSATALGRRIAQADVLYLRRDAGRARLS